MDDFGRIAIQHDMVNIPCVNYIPYDSLAVLETEIDLKACPVIHDIGTFRIVPTMKNNFLWQGGIYCHRALDDRACGTNQMQQDHKENGSFVH